MTTIPFRAFKSFVITMAMEGNLYVKMISTFDAMEDGVIPAWDEFRKVEKVDMDEKNTLGIHGLWLVGDRRDYFETYEDDRYYGYRVSNCCGSAIIAMDFTTKK